MRIYDNKTYSDLSDFEPDKKLLNSVSLVNTENEFFDIYNERIKIGCKRYTNETPKGKYELIIRESKSSEKPTFHISVSWEKKRTEREILDRFSLGAINNYDNLLEYPYMTVFGYDELNNGIKEAINLIKKHKNDTRKNK